MAESIFITGYSSDNLQTSKQRGILGWKQNSKRKELTKGDYIFVYNIDSKKIECLFRIDSRIPANDFLWNDEVKQNTVKYKNRWTADLILDNLIINANDILNIHPFNIDQNRFYLFIKNPFPNFLDEKFDDFRNFLLTNSKLDDFSLSHNKVEINSNQKNSLQYFLVQVNEYGSKNILNNNKYEHSDWKEKLKDQDHGKVKKGDILLVYFARNSVQYKLQLRKIYSVNSVSPDNTIFYLKELREIQGLSIYKIKNSIDNGKLGKTFEKLGQQGFNIKQISESEYNTILSLSNKDIGNSNLFPISYEDLITYIKQHTMKENYQPVVIKTLIENQNRVTKQQIQNQLKIYNLESESKSMTETVLSVLLNNQIIKKESDNYVLNIDYQLNNEQKNYIINLCDIRIKEFLTKEANTNNKIEYKEDLTQFDKNNILGEDNDLPFPSKDQIENAIEEIQKELFIDKNTIKEIIYNLLSGKNILLAGPVGTGKTHLAKLIPEKVWKEYDNGYYPEIVTATSEWTTTEVIGGIYPNIEDSKISYSFIDGCITKTLKLNWIDETCQLRRKYSKDNKRYRGIWLIIDEFNRANIDRCFGEMFTSLEYKELTLLTIDKLIIPKDYRIIATLNVFDKHYLFRMSDALKRRFAYIEIFPNFISNDFDEEKEKYYSLFRAFNDLLKNNSLNTNPTYENKIVLDHENKIIDTKQSDKEFINIIDSCYFIFKFIRHTKNLGTGILIAIIKYILVGSLKYKENLDYLLDVALKSNVIPQLETIQKASLQTLLYFCQGKIGELFENKRIDDLDYKIYKIEFAKLSKYFNRDQTLDILIQNKNVNWELYNPWSGHTVPNLPLFTNALSDLIENNDMV